MDESATMLTLVTRSLRARAAWLLAAFYLICVMSPALTLTLGSGKSVACLVQDNHSSSASHIHPVPSAGVHHVDADPAQQESDGKMSAVADAADELSAGDHGSDDTHRHRSNQCCGLSCVSALPAAMPDVGRPAVLTTTHQALVVQVLGNKPSKPLYRPPIA